MSTRLKFRPKYDKIVEALLYIATKRPDTDHYAASKYVYLADWRHFNRYGRPITFDQIGAMPWGPVALKTYELLKQEIPAMRAAGISSLPFSVSRVDKVIYIGAPQREVDISVFSESDIEVLDQILEEFGTLTMPQLHDLTKRHVGYSKAWSNREPDSRLAEIPFDDLLDSAYNKEQLIEDLLPVSSHI